MIPDTPAHYVFIRLSILSLRTVAPASIFYCVSRLFGYGFLPLPFEVIAFVEAIFLLFISLPRQHVLDKSKPLAPRRSLEERQQLFDKCLRSLPDLESFLITWFKGRALRNVRADDIKDLMAWAFCYKTRGTPADDDELNGYLDRAEKILGRTFRPGRGLYRPSQVSTDPLNLQHRPFLFYVVAVGVDDFITYVTLRRASFVHYRLPSLQSLTVFPFRPHTAFTTYVSPSKHLSYWCRPHTSNATLPVLFLHGIGAGLRTYSGFLRDVVEKDVANDGQTGIIAIEIMPISMRITRGALPRREMLAELLSILVHHRWDKFVVAAHSYGTILATHLLQIPETRDRVSSMLLIDPVTVAIHWGGVPYNFLYRPPRMASEWQLHYFASTDMGVAHALTRRFDWSENVLWKDEMRGRRITVVLGGKDIILDSHAVRKYLMDDPELDAEFVDSRSYSVERSDSKKSRDMRLVWYDHCNHAGMFDTAIDWEPLVDELLRHCSIVKPD